jgi:GT2 family glycosyltransferase
MAPNPEASPVNASATATSVSVVVCTRNRPAQIRACLESFLPDVAGQVDILVVDQSDNGATEEITRSLNGGSGFRYVRYAPWGLSASRNKAVLASSGDVVLFVDDDCRIQPGWLTAWISVLASSEKIGVAFGAVLAGQQSTPGGWLPTFGGPASTSLCGRELFL